MTPKIAVVTLFAGGFTTSSMLWVHLNHRNFCLKHGYVYEPVFEPAPDKVTQAHLDYCCWRKLDLVESLLKQYDFLFWLDADCVFHRFHRTLEHLCHPESQIVVSHSATDGRSNTGAFMLTSAPKTFDLLRVWKSLRIIYPRPPKEPWRDTSAQHYIQANLRHFNYTDVEAEDLHSLYPHWTDQDLCRHFPWKHHADTTALIETAAKEGADTVPSTRSGIYELAKQMGLNRSAVEIGVCEGQNAKAMLDHGEFQSITLCDPWQHVDGAHGVTGHPQERHEAAFEKCKAQMQTYGNRVRIVRKTSTELADETPNESLDFVHIDADHRYEKVLQDIWAWHRKVKVGGIVSGDDFKVPSAEPHYGVRRAVLNFYSGVPVHITYMGANTAWYVFKP